MHRMFTGDVKPSYPFVLYTVGRSCTKPGSHVCTEDDPCIVLYMEFWPAPRCLDAYMRNSNSTQTWNILINIFGKIKKQLWELTKNMKIMKSSYIYHRIRVNEIRSYRTPNNNRTFNTIVKDSMSIIYYL